MTRLIFGTTGQVATALADLHPEGVFLGRDAVDLTDAEACIATIRHHTPRLVINAAAYTAVDRAEEDEATALAVNGAAPGAMARTCAELGIPFLHISTDYVFDGAGDHAWREEDPVAPLGAYGRTKLAGEAAIQAAGGPHVILRTAWVFSATGANFVKTMLRLADTRDALSVVADQIGGPTPAKDIAAALLAIADAFDAGRGRNGIYHFAGQPPVSWAAFAREIFALAARDVTVTGIPATDYPTPAARPANSRLDCTKITRDYGIPPPDWRAGLAQVLKELTPHAT